MRCGSGRPHGVGAIAGGWMGRGMSALGGAVALVLAGAAAAAATSQQRMSGPTSLVFDEVTVVDVEQGKLLPGQRVVIVGNRIQAMGGSSTVKMPKDAQIVAARGKYLIPGLWDLHVHPMHYATDYFYPLFVANGITGIRDAFSTWPLDTLIQWRREILAGTRVGPPRQILSGAAINEEEDCNRTTLTGHTCVSPGDSAGARRLVNDLKAAGADMIKMYLLSKEMYFVIAAEARRIGIPFGGHLHLSRGGPTALEASDSGASILDHMNASGMLDSFCILKEASVQRCRPLAERMKRNGTWFVPTILPMRHYLGFSLTPRGDSVYQALAKLSPNLWGAWSEGTISAPGAPGVFSIMRDAGMPIAVGTDIAIFDVQAMPGEERVSRELTLYAAEGLSPLEALQTATLNPAKMLRATDSLGTVAPGKLADLVLLDSDPLTDITNITRIRAVVANGRYFDRATLDGLLAEVRANAEGP